MDEPRPRVVLWTVALLLVAAGSRLIAYPASIWDLDEANFALGVLRFDPVHNQPHPPFFPLWIGIGKLVHAVLPGMDPADVLRPVSVLASVLVVVPLGALLRRLLTLPMATVATATYLSLPACWLLAGRSYSEPTATTLWLVAAAFWLERRPSTCRAVAGAVAMSAALLIRPQWLLASIPLAVWALVRTEDRRGRLAVAAIPAVAAAVAAGFVVASSRGLQPLVEAVRQHLSYMSSSRQDFAWSAADLAPFQALGGWQAGCVWLVVTLVGVVLLVRRRRQAPLAIPYLALLLLPHSVQLFVGQNPTLPRYALPVLALSMAPAAVAAATMASSQVRGILALAVAAAVATATVLPALPEYRSRPSPVVAAFGLVAARPQAGVVALDRRLVAHVALAQACGRLHDRVVWDVQVEAGLGSGQGGPGLLAVTRGSQVPRWLDEPGEVTTFSVHNRLLRRVVAPRQLDVTVIEGGVLKRPAANSPEHR